MHRNRQRFDFANFLDKTLEIDKKKIRWRDGAPGVRH